LTRITTLKLSSLEKILGAVHAAINIGISSQDMEELEAFLRPALCIDPKKRATAKELLAHPWMN
jgi:serine/threonine protein kinase